MNVLVDLGHPAHVHLFRNPIQTWKDRGDQVYITIRKRDIVPTLLQAYQLPYEVASVARKGLVGMAWELLEHDWYVWKAVRKYQIDVMLGTSVAIAHASRLSKAVSLVFSEDDADYTSLYTRITYPFANHIIIPDTLRDRRTSRYITHNSYHELAYLHPNHYQPDASILDDLGVKNDETYFIVRLVAMKAYHDVNHTGLSFEARHKLVEYLAQRGKVFITVEGDLPEEFRPYQFPLPAHKIHDALAFATMLVSDSQTMTMEAAILGTPAIRCNTFVGLCSVIEELEHRYGLTYGFNPQDEQKMFAKIEELLSDPHLKQTWAQKRAVLLSEKIDLAQWIVAMVDRIMATRTA